MKKIIVLLCVLLLSGCSTTFAYNNASWLVHWYLDDFVELNAEQEEQFDKVFEQWMTWHRNEELPLYQAHLQDVVKDIQAKNISQTVIEQHRERARQHWVRARTYVANDIVDLAVTLDDKQIAGFFKALEDENIEDEERIADRREKSEEKQVKDWVKRNKKNIRNWIGKLSNGQEQIIGSYYDDFASTGDYWIEYKREYQQQLRETFDMPERDELFKNNLYKLIVDPEKYRSAAFQTLMDENATVSANYMIEVFEASSDKQVKRLLSKIEDLQDDISYLQKKKS